MIAAVKGWYAATAALLFFFPPGASAAEDSNGAARELARKTAAFAGREPVSAGWRNASPLSSSEIAQTRAVFEAALREFGGRLGDQAPAVEVRITMSEDRSQYLLVEEARKGEERQVWIASWKRAGAGATAAAAVTLDKKFLWEQQEPMLDMAFAAGTMLVLSPTRVARLERQGTQWVPRDSAALPAGKPWPRDLRGHLRVTATAFQVFLPGTACAGSLEPALALECRQTDEPWVLESGSRALLLATFAPARNFFDGRVISQAGARKSVPPFYSAAAVEDQGRTLWILALVDGRAQLFDAALDAVGTLSAAWGSDIVGTDARCGGGSQLLATRPGDGNSPDAVQAFAIVNREPGLLTAAAEFPGPVLALWGAGGGAAVAIVRNPVTGKYEAYSIAVVCA
jgi:hypothetical protein